MGAQRRATARRASPRGVLAQGPGYPGPFILYFMTLCDEPHSYINLSRLTSRGVLLAPHGVHLAATACERTRRIHKPAQACVCFVHPYPLFSLQNVTCALHSLLLLLVGVKFLCMCGGCAPTRFCDKSRLHLVAALRSAEGYIHQIAFRFWAFTITDGDC